MCFPPYLVRQAERLGCVAPSYCIAEASESMAVAKIPGSLDEAGKCEWSQHSSVLILSLLAQAERALSCSIAAEVHGLLPSPSRLLELLTVLCPLHFTTTLLKPLGAGRPHKENTLFACAWWALAPRDYNNQKDHFWQITTPRALHRYRMEAEKCVSVPHWPCYSLRPLRNDLIHLSRVQILTPISLGLPRHLPFGRLLLFMIVILKLRLFIFAFFKSCGLRA